MESHAQSRGTALAVGVLMRASLAGLFALSLSVLHSGEAEAFDSPPGELTEPQPAGASITIPF